jgi:hypothetical protein
MPTTTEDVTETAGWKRDTFQGNYSRLGSGYFKRELLLMVFVGIVH